MGRCIGANEIILLFDSYSLEGRYLHESVERAGYKTRAIVIEEDDFLPRGVISVYDLLSSDWKEENKGKGAPLFFNEIVAPDHWSISAGVEEPYGKITYQHEEKGRIYYIEPVRKYLVKAVDWFDRKGAVRFRDHYNRYGIICARTVYNAGGQQLSKSWFSARGQEILMENYVTGDIIFNDGDIVKHFRTKIDLICYCFTKIGIADNRIFFNSLSTPFFLSNRLKASAKKDILFWQEPVQEDIPENMQIILKGRARRTDKIVVQKRQAYDKLLELGAEKDRLFRLGFIYPFAKENGHKPEALIYTDSDRIEHCQELIKAFPQMHFHIAAITVMSQTLKNLESLENVSLYPAVKSPVREELFRKCDYYFDINYYGEVISAVQKAFVHNLLIFAFRETVHNKEYVDDAHIYQISEFEKMVSDIKSTIEKRTVMEEHLEKQNRHALTEDKEAYANVIEM